MNELIAFLGKITNTYTINIVLSLLAVSIYFLFRRIVIPRLESYVARDQLKQETFQSALYTFSIFAALFVLAVILMIWGINVRELLAVSTGILALTGVALFATWSILSNVTAFFILLAHPVYKRGNYIRVFDNDNYVEGYISQINIFNTILTTEDKETIVYPNNLMTARATIINPKKRAHTVGKIEDFRNQDKRTDGILQEQE